MIIPDAFPCEEGLYPYPDECVRVVVGLNDSAVTLPSVFERLRTNLAVTTQVDLAENAFKEAFPGFTPLLSLSLDDVHFQVEELRSLRRENPKGVLHRATHPFEQPYLVTHHDSLGRLFRRAVIATSAVDARKKVVPQPCAGIAMPLGLLEDIETQMECIRVGKEPAPYLWDYSQGGDFERAQDRQIAAWSPEKRERAEAKLTALEPYRKGKTG